MKINKKSWKDAVFWIFPVIFLLLFYFFPMGSILANAFKPAAGSNITDELNWSIAGKAIGFTFYQASISTFITLLVGFPLAYFFARFAFPGRRFLRILATLPFILPTVVVAAGFNALIGPRGWINLVLMDIFKFPMPPISILNSVPAIILAHVFYNTSIVIRVVGSAWEQLDLNLENAAKMLGANRWKVFSRVSMPLLLPSILSAAVLVFLFDFTSFGVILLMGGARFTTIEVEIYIQTMQFLNLRMAGILSLIQLFFSMAFTLLSLRVGKGDNIPIVPMTKGEGLRAPGSLFQKVFVFISALFVIVLLVMPSAALLLRSVVIVPILKQAAEGSKMQLTLQHFQGLFINERNSLFFVPPITAFLYSMLYAVGATIIALFLGISISVNSTKRKRSSRVLELLVMLPLGTSAVTLGLGYLSAFSTSPNSIRWFPLLIISAHALIALPFVVRIIQPAVESIPANIHEAAITLGVQKSKLWRKINLPLIKNSIITASIYAFALSLGEFGATSFLSRPEYPTLPLAIYRYLTLPGGENYGKAMAMAALLLIICGSAFFLIEKLHKVER